MSDFFGKDRAAVVESLGERFPTTAIKKHPQKGWDYVEGHSVIHRLNDATNNTWDFEIKNIRFEEFGKGTKVTAHVRLTIPTLGSREHIGVQLVYDKGEDLVKGAITDALKKAATLFGPGLELYGPDYADGETFVNRVPQQQQRAPQRPQQGYNGGNQQAHTGTPNRPQNAPTGHSGGPQPTDKQWGMFNALVQKHRLNGAVVAQQVAGVLPDALTGGKGGGMSQCLDRLKSIDDGQMEIPNAWRLSHEDIGQPQQHDAPDMDRAKQNWLRNIRNAQSPAQLDQMWSSIQRAGLGDDSDIVSLMGEVEEQLLASGT